MEILLSIAVALLCGLLMTRVIKPLGLPAVTGYLVAGILIGPYVLGALGVEGLGFTSMEYVERFGVIADVALGFIAFSIGNEFRLSQIKSIGKQALIVGVIQALMATLFVDIALIGMSFILGNDVFPISAAITLGAVATATAPAATLMVVRQYKAKGPLTKILLPVVALDDAVGLIVFAVSFGIAKAMILGTIDLLSIAAGPLVKILASGLLGTLAGITLTWLETLFHSNTNRTSLTIAFVILTVGLSSLEFPAGGFYRGASGN